MDPVFDPRTGQMVDPQTGLPVSGNYQPPPRVSTFDQMFNGTGIPERINAGHSLFNPVVALGESGQHTQNMLSPGRAPWERVSDLGKAMTGMAGTVAPMMMAARGALPVTNALVDAMSGISLPGGEFLADEFGGVKMPGKDGITAYHGSPHSFDKFSMDKIGTGEGAQAYGHGLYFAENEGVARGYRDALAGDFFVTPKGETFDPATLGHLNVRSFLNRTGDAQGAIDRAKALLPDANDQTRPLLEADIAVLDRVLMQGGLSKPKGSMYEVRINANPDDFLDWDKPLSEQPAKVRDALKKVDVNTGGSMTVKDRVETVEEAMKGDPRLAHLVKDRSINAPADSVYKGMAAKSGQPAVTNTLREAGIPGIKYLDAGSRGAGDGSRNYVVFDENLIEIVKKYGIAGAAAMLGMSAADLENRMGVPKMTPGGLGVTQ